MEVWLAGIAFIAALASIYTTPKTWSWLPTLLRHFKSKTSARQGEIHTVEIKGPPAFPDACVEKLLAQSQQNLPHPPQAIKEPDEIPLEVSEQPPVNGDEGTEEASAEAPIPAPEDNIPASESRRYTIPSLRHWIPAPPARFIGRAVELSMIRDALHENETNIIEITGAAGIGKTALALKAAAGYAAMYPDAHIYVDGKGSSETPLSVIEIMASVIYALQPAAKLPEREADMESLYVTLLTGKRVLLVLDDIAGAGKMELLAPPSGTTLLITSHTAIMLPGMTLIELNTLPFDDARSLLLSQARTAGEKADEITRLCGGIPLAVQLSAGALSRAVNLPPTKHVQQLIEAESQHEVIEAGLRVSLDLLDEERRRQWQALTLFNITFDSAAAAAAWGLSREVAQIAIHDFTARNLMEQDEASGRYRLHGTLRTIGIEIGSELDIKEACIRLAAHYKEILVATDELYSRDEDARAQGLAHFDLEWSSIRQGWQWANEHSREASALLRGYVDAGKRILSLRLSPGERVTLLEESLAALQSTDNAQTKAHILIQLGAAYQALDNTPLAVEKYKQANEMAQQAHDSAAESAALYNLGNISAHAGDLQQAIQLYEQSLAAARSAGDVAAEANALGNLGAAYRQAGQSQRAIEYLEQSLAVDRQAGNRAGEEMDLCNLGSAYHSLGQYQRAIVLYNQGLNIAQELDDQHAVGRYHWNIAMAYQELGESDNAVSNGECAAAIFERLDPTIAAKIKSSLTLWKMR